MGIVVAAHCSGVEIQVCEVDVGFSNSYHTDIHKKISYRFES